MVLKGDVVLFSLHHFLNISGSVFLLCGFHFDIFSFRISDPFEKKERPSWNLQRSLAGGACNFFSLEINK